jgi:hypothetical protein
MNEPAQQQSSKMAGTLRLHQLAVRYRFLVITVERCAGTDTSLAGCLCKRSNKAAVDVLQLQ